MKKIILIITSFMFLTCNAYADHDSGGSSGNSSSSTIKSAGSDRSFARFFKPTELNIAWYADSFSGLPLAPSQSAFNIEVNNGDSNGNGRFVKVWAQDFATGNTMSCTMSESVTGFNTYFAEMQSFTQNSAISIWHNNGVCTMFRLSGRIL